ncbi:LA2681 family HEPN domain-containing protein [Clostridium sp. ZBS2]|uniref:LA2681 family HEPN domain-containing protein n=1 Tax=Clostridium sp. ZBS2 TaxID=2949976 RepID=UPI0020797906|nr:LA2681 family HEPN domain-containing protein [Clostridium sp. ZBS2]
MINEKINIIAMFADKAFDEEESETLKSIANDCLKFIGSDEYSDLEKAILAYHGATSYSNYIGIRDKGIMNYFGDNANESDFEFCIYLYRKSIRYFEKINVDEMNEIDKSYYLNYKLMVYTNYSNILYETGRLIVSIDKLKNILDYDFSMAIGNLGCKLKVYADYDYDTGHKYVLYKQSYNLLNRIVNNKQLHSDAKKFFEKEKTWLEENVGIEELTKESNYNKETLGDNEDEIGYRVWCKENILFLNTLNDAVNYSEVAYDIIHLPNMVALIDSTPKCHGLFNQIKQEYVSARYMIYECLDTIDSCETHFSDKDVYMVDTLDYSVYGLKIEKMKYAYRAFYSLFDRIAYFINYYFELGIKERDISYKSIWMGEKSGKKGYKFNYNLKEKMMIHEEYNYPLIGLYWLFKDISKKKVKHNYLEPEIEQISDIRNSIEHKYLKIIDDKFLGFCNNEVDDDLAYIKTFREFEEASIRLMKYAREAIILLSLSVHCEERFRARKRNDNQFIMPIDLLKYEDEWKY